MSTREFYDDLSDDYHLIFEDWRRTVLAQGETLDRLIRDELGAGPRAIYDCSCGIGTQAIGLAARGHRVHATDLSGRAVERAVREAASFGVTLTTGVADMRELGGPDLFDAVITCDNALPHLDSDDDWRLALRAIRSKLKPGGLFLSSIRDYDAILLDRAQATLPRVYDGARRIVFQVWDWIDDRFYTFHHFILTSGEGGWVTKHRSALYRAVLRDEFSRLLKDAGFRKPHWLLPDRSGYYQPIVLARSP